MLELLLKSDNNKSIPSGFFIDPLLTIYLGEVEGSFKEFNGN